MEDLGHIVFLCCESYNALHTLVMRCWPGGDSHASQASETSVKLPTLKRGLATHQSTFVIPAKSCARKMSQEAAWTHNTLTAYPNTRRWRRCVSRQSIRRPANNQDRYKLKHTHMHYSFCHLYCLYTVYYEFAHKCTMFALNHSNSLNLGLVTLGLNQVFMH